MLHLHTEAIDIHSNKIIQNSNEVDIIEINDSNGANSNDGLFTVDDLYSKNAFQQSELYLFKLQKSLHFNLV